MIEHLLLLGVLGFQPVFVCEQQHGTGTLADVLLHKAARELRPDGLRDLLDFRQRYRSRQRSLFAGREGSLSNGQAIPIIGHNRGLLQQLYNNAVVELPCGFADVLLWQHGGGLFCACVKQASCVNPGVEYVGLIRCLKCGEGFRGSPQKLRHGVFR